VIRLGALVGGAFLVAASSAGADCPGQDSALRLPAACIGETTSGAATSACSDRVPPSPIGTGLAPSVAQRARIAFTRVLHTPAKVRSFLTVLAEAQARSELGPATTRTLRRRGRLLLRGTKTLKGDLRRLQRVSQTFAR
jgi:hypothetical protein